METSLEDCIEQCKDWNKWGPHPDEREWFAHILHYLQLYQNVLNAGQGDFNDRLN